MPETRNQRCSKRTHTASYLLDRTDAVVVSRSFINPCFKLTSSHRGEANFLKAFMPSHHQRVQRAYNSFFLCKKQPVMSLVPLHCAIRALSSSQTSPNVMASITLSLSPVHIQVKTMPGLLKLFRQSNAWRLQD